jgi:hypothetical protein
MALPSAPDMERVYPLADWDRDLGHWFSKGPLSPSDFPRFGAYFERTQAGNPMAEENSRRMWAALAFVQSFQPALIQGGAILVGPSGQATLPPSLVTALYRAFMSPVAATHPRAITVPLILEAVKEQKDWNEDRT